MTQENKVDEMDNWRIMIEDNTPLNYNPHGTFKKGDCEIKIGLHTNSGYFYSSSGGCGSAACKACQMCEELENIPIDEDEEHLEEYLEIFSTCGYKFIGWPDLEKNVKKAFAKNDSLFFCSCNDKKELERLRKLVEVGTEPLFPPIISKISDADISPEGKAKQYNEAGTPFFFVIYEENYCFEEAGKGGWDYFEQEDWKVEGVFETLDKAKECALHIIEKEKSHKWKPITDGYGGYTASSKIKKGEKMYYDVKILDEKEYPN